MKFTGYKTIDVFFESFFSVKGLFYLFIFILLFPRFIVGYGGLSLDSSWQLALNMALKSNMSFGQDFIFTYGPLGFLSTRLSTEVPYAYIYLFLLDCFIAINILWIFRDILNKHNNKISFLIIFVLAYNLSYTELVYKLMIIFAFHAFRLIHKNNLFSIFIIIFLPVLSFFIKPSAGFYFIIVSFFLTLYLGLIQRKYLNLFLIPFIGSVIFLISKLFNIYLTNYLLFSLKFSSTYSEAMNITPTRIVTLFFLGSAIIIIGLFVVQQFFYFKTKKITQQDFVMYVLMILLSYFVFKQSFVRMDYSHVIIFWSTFIILWGLIIFREPFEINKTSLRFYFLGLTISCFQISFVSDLSANKYPLNVPFKYFKVIKQVDMFNKQSKDAILLPDSIIKKIDNRSTDILPNKISIIYYNGLNYNPRPVIQSYIACDEYSNKVNYNKYKSNTAPEFILFSNNSIDKRHPFWDESYTKLALLTNYTVVDSLFETKANNDTLFLLKRNLKPTEFSLDKISNAKIEIDRYYNLPNDSDIIVLQADIKYNMYGKLLKLLYQAPIINIELFYADGFKSFHRIVVPEIKNGVVINKKLISQVDAFNFYKYYGRKNTQVVKLKFFTEDKGFVNNINIILKKIVLKNNEIICSNTCL